MKVKHCHVPCRFCGGDDHDGHLFWECTFPPLVEIRENPEFHELMEMDKSFWPRCLLWHGWLPLLSGANLGSPWAQDLSQGAGHLLESALGSYSAAPLLDWRLPVGFDAEVAALQVAQEPDVWTDGSRTEDKLSSVSSSGAGFSTGLSSRFWAGCSWGHVDSDVQGDLAVASCRGYCSVPGPLQSVQRAELWGVILALQASGGVHLGVDNLNVVRHVGRMLDNNLGSLPFQVLPDGDLLCLIHRMLVLRGLDTVRVTKVKGHASEDMVADGRVRNLDRLGNRAADEAADFGRRRVPVRVIDARRNLVGVCDRWYPVVCVLHRFFVAIARAVVNHDEGGGTAPHPLVWSAGSLPKRRRDVDAVRNFAFLPGPACLWSGEWVSFGVSGVTVDDVRVWPYSVSHLVKVSAFLGTLHWPVAADDLGVGGVSFVELLILYELWAGERLSLEKAVPKRRRAGRPILVSAVPFGPGIDIWRSCRFFGLVFVPFLYCLVVLVGFFLGGWVLIIVAFATLVGKNVIMDLLLGPVRLLLFGFWMSFLFFLGIHLALVLVCLLGLYLLGFSLRVLLVGSPLGVCLRVVMLLVSLLLGDWSGVVIMLCPLRWVVLVFTWVVVLEEALKESDYTGKHQHTLLDRVFRGFGFVPGFGRDFGFLWALILVFLVPRF